MSRLVIFALAVVPATIATIALRSSSALLDCFACAGDASPRAARGCTAEEWIASTTESEVLDGSSACSAQSELSLSARSTDLPAEGGVVELTFRARSAIDVWDPHLDVGIPEGSVLLDQLTSGGVVIRAHSADGSPLLPLTPDRAAVEEKAPRSRVLAAGAEASGTLQIQVPPAGARRMVYAELRGSMAPTSSSPGRPLRSNAVVLHATERDVGLPQVVLEGGQASRDIRSTER